MPISSKYTQFPSLLHIRHKDSTENNIDSHLEISGEKVSIVNYGKQSYSNQRGKFPIDNNYWNLPIHRTNNQKVNHESIMKSALNTKNKKVHINQIYIS